MYLRKANDRGQVDIGWLDSKHSFSFGHYHDPEHMGFSVLRVINEDRVVPKGGFAQHGHRDMEIISYVIDGKLAHKDTLGNSSIITPGEVQRMSAGTGIEHSEYNASDEKPVHFLQIWVLPERNGIEPGYAQKRFFNGDENDFNDLKLLVSGDEQDNVVHINQDIRLYAAKMKTGLHVAHKANNERSYWVQVVKGNVSINNEALSSGDGLGIKDISLIEIHSESDSEILLFDLPK